MTHMTNHSGEARPLRHNAMSDGQTPRVPRVVWKIVNLLAPVMAGIMIAVLVTGVLTGLILMAG
jgi:hypothetical protein